MHTVGVADTMFARIDMAAEAIPVFEEAGLTIERYTVPGFKDLAVASKKLIEEHHCDIVIAFGMAGGTDIDEECAHTASSMLKHAELMTNKHIIEVFVFTRETDDEGKLAEIAKDRARKHAENVVKLLKGKEALTPYAGKGKRQGGEDAGPIAE